MEREIQKLSWTKVKNMVPKEIDTVLFPLGTVEAHGPNALGTDNLIPEKIALDQAERLNSLIAPTLNYGITKSLYMYPGSITVRPKNYAPFVSDILFSLAKDKFKNIIILNGHGGNNGALKEAAYDVHFEHNVNIAVIHWWMLCGDMTKEFFGQAGGHAGLDETAAVQAIDPALVDKDEYDQKMAFLMKPGADIYPSPGSILLYTDGEGYPNFNKKQADEYLPKVCRTVGDYILKLKEQWKLIKA